jgi:hypothetical protein
MFASGEREADFVELLVRRSFSEVRWDVRSLYEERSFSRRPSCSTSFPFSLQCRELIREFSLLVGDVSCGNTSRMDEG